MEEVKKQEATQPEKMTYEQLEQVAHELSDQNRKLYAKLQELNMANVFKRMDYLFKVVELQDKGFTGDFVVKAVEEIEDLMTIPKEPQEEKKEE